MKYALILTAALLAGCATTPPTTDIPIAVACKTETPTPPTLHYHPPYTNVFEGVRDLIGDRVAMIGYETQLEAALKSCK